MPIPEVEVATVKRATSPCMANRVATLDGTSTQRFAPSRSYIIKQNYTEGSLVRKGQVLFEIDPRPLSGDA